MDVALFTKVTLPGSPSDDPRVFHCGTQKVMLHQLMTRNLSKKSGIAALVGQIISTSAAFPSQVKPWMEETWQKRRRA
jgi:hypothetical protein